MGNDDIVKKRMNNNNVTRTHDTANISDNDATLQTTKSLDNRCSGTAGLFRTADLELVTLSHFPHRL